MLIKYGRATHPYVAMAITIRTAAGYLSGKKMLFKKSKMIVFFFVHFLLHLYVAYLRYECEYGMAGWLVWVVYMTQGMRNSNARKYPF